MKQLTKEQAINMSSSNIWKVWNYRQRTEFQMLQDLLCMPFSVFRVAIEKTLQRPVLTHDIGLNRDGLMNEVFLGHEPPTLEDIINMIPEDKRIVIGL